MPLSRFSEPMTSTEKINFSVTGGMTKCLDEMATARGISRAELVRRLVARAIVDDAPRALSKSARRHREALEQLAGL